MRCIVIAIDGPAASGKSTAARLVAERLNAGFIDTGAMYRAVTLAAMEAGCNLADERELVKVMQGTEFGFKAERGKMLVSINGIDRTERIRETDVTAKSRYAASAPEIRRRLVEIQRRIAAAEKKDYLVTEGRDQGTAAFPDARVKFFLTAEVKVRARRRQAELFAQGQKADIEEVQRAIEARDTSDRERSTGPLKPAEDAIIIDTTNLDIEGVTELLVRNIREHV